MNLLFDEESAKQCVDDREDAMKELAKAWDGIDVAELRFDNEIGWHETLDRSNLVQETFEQYVLNHPCVVMDADLHAKAWGINELVLNLYQEIGRKASEALEKVAEVDG